MSEDDGQQGSVPAATERVPGYGPQTAMTPGHRDLTQEQRRHIELVRNARRAFVTTLHAIGGTTLGSAGPMGSANLAIALRHVEDAEYRAVRHITGGPAD